MKKLILIFALLLLLSTLAFAEATSSFLDGVGWTTCVDSVTHVYLGDVPERYWQSQAMANNYCVTHY